MENPSENLAGLTAGLTPMQADFVKYSALDGMPLCKAAEAAGYSHPATAGSNVARLPHVRAAMHAVRQSALEGDLSSASLRLIRRLLDDDSFPAPVRFQAARWVLESAGHGAHSAGGSGGAPEPERALHEMSVEELEGFIRRGEAAMASMKRVGGSIPIKSPSGAPSGGAV